MGKKIAFVAMVAAMALPAAAPAANWKHSGVDITQKKTIALTGTVAFAGGVHCPEVKAVVDLEPGSTGTVTSFDIEDTSKCTTSDALAAIGCKTVTAHKMDGTWVVHDNGTSIGLDGFKLTVTYEGTGLCVSPIVVEYRDKFATQIVMTPNNVNSIGSLTLSGEMTSGGNSLAVSGTLNVLAPNAGTYGL